MLRGMPGAGGLGGPWDKLMSKFYRHQQQQQHQQHQQQQQGSASGSKDSRTRAPNPGRKESALQEAVNTIESYPNYGLHGAPEKSEHLVLKQEREAGHPATKSPTPASPSTDTNLFVPFRGYYTTKACNARDHQRMQKALRKSTDETKWARKKRRAAARTKGDSTASHEGPTYEPGAF
ncbi:uncharacterized protein LOC119449188 [Dermacentor silvarum]|uniref:uncharacterized protein LOC119449188 n=1 Tax=Dermacentor silvarum TaxID=543639 RepID=UPI0018989F93|nr:uncharacterized protein LOC119449188 [Dermacentor silvarum]